MYICERHNMVGSINYTGNNYGTKFYLNQNRNE